MQTIRLLSLLLLLCVVVAQNLEKPDSEPSDAVQELIKPRSAGAVSEPQAQRFTSRAQRHRREPSSEANSNAVFEPHPKLPRGAARLPGQRDVAPGVIEGLRLLGQACVDYRKRTGKFPPSLAALKVTHQLDMRHGYRFNYTRQRSADSFAVTAVPAVAHLRGLPTLSIDKSQAIRVN
jgi:hypothetical protein